MNNKHLSWYKEINNNFIIASRAYFLQCASNLLVLEDLGQFEEAHHWNIQAKFYNEKFPLVYESDNIRDSLYEEHGATLKLKCGKG